MSVYTTIEQSELREFLGHYNVGELTGFEGISDGIENTNYFVNTDLAGFVLTLFEHHGFEEMQYFLNLMHHLADHGVPSANPVADNQGHYLRLFKGKPAALVERLSGGSIRETTLGHCEQLGAAMGKLHSAGLGFGQRRDNPRGPHWFAQTARQVRDRLSTAEQTLLDNELRYQGSRRDADIPRGVIHADLFRDNCLWDGDRLSGIIDFYYACDDVLLYDLAVAVNDWCCHADFSLDRDKTVTLLAAYNRERPFNTNEQAFWPTMLRAGALRFWLSRLYDKHFPREGDLVHTKNPDEFRAILSDRVANNDVYSDYWV